MLDMGKVNVTVDFNRATGKIKPVNGVGQPPFFGTDFSYVSYLKEANIPFSRLHDVGGVYGQGRYVDIPNIFRRFDADPSDPASYDFAFTDLLVTALVENGVEPFFRLGVTIENAAAIKSYRIDPPKDFLKWAKICEGIIRHYTEGWANGFRYNIRYWEIWNEPDLTEYGSANVNQCWSGTKLQFFEFYTVASKYLKEKFPNLKIGGFGSVGFYGLTDAAANADAVGAGTTGSNNYHIVFFNEFLKYIKERNAPLDFFSWHTYAETDRAVKHAAYARRRLDEEGFTETETTCNEWNDHCKLVGTAYHAALIARRLAAFQESPLDSAMFYDARIGGDSTYAGLFAPENGAPRPAYYSFKMFGELYRLGTQVAVEGDLPDGISVTAATDGKRGAVLLSNSSSVSVNAAHTINFDFAGQKAVSCRIVDHSHLYLPWKVPGTLFPDTVMLIETEKE